MVTLVQVSRLLVPGHLKRPASFSVQVSVRPPLAGGGRSARVTHPDNGLRTYARLP